MDDLNFFGALNLLDLALISILSFSFVLGIFRGLIRETLSVVSWVLSAWLAPQYRDEIGVYLPAWLKWEILPDIAQFAIVFLISLVLLSLISWIINKIIQISVPAVMNRLFGAGFGILRGLLICALLLIVGQNVSILETQLLDSVLTSYFSWVVDWMTEVAPELWLKGQ